MGDASNMCSSLLWCCTPTKRCALGFPPRRPLEFWMANPRVVEATVAKGLLPKPPPRRMARGPPPTPRARVPPQPLRLHHAAVDGGLLTTTSPRRMTGKDGGRQLVRAPPKRAEGTRLTRTGATAKQAPRQHPQACCTFQTFQ